MWKQIKVVDITTETFTVQGKQGNDNSISSMLCLYYKCGTHYTWSPICHARVSSPGSLSPWSHTNEGAHIEHSVACKLGIIL